ncbi:MAG: metallophosphoesterase [Clostridia bacterium]|nr:metallophosphoesterase [Clostridia bacterium]
MKKPSAIKRIIAVLLLLPLTLCVLFGVFALISVSKNGRIISSNYTVISSKLTGGLRIALISDLHARVYGDDNEPLVDLVRSSSPDIICLGGDMFEGHLLNEQFEPFLSLIERLAEIAPVYYVPGNHDYLAYGGATVRGNREFTGYDSRSGEIAVLEAAGAKFLESEYVDVEINGQNLRIGGYYPLAFQLEDETDEEFAARIAFLGEFAAYDGYKLLLSHRPDTFIYEDAAVDWDIDLVLCGHTHGGVIRLPLIGALWTSEGFFPKYDMGEFDLGSMKMIITSGLNGYGRIPRVFNPPEIAVIDLAPAE